MDPKDRPIERQVDAWLSGRYPRRSCEGCAVVWALFKAWPKGVRFDRPGLEDLDPQDLPGPGDTSSAGHRETSREAHASIRPQTIDQKVYGLLLDRAGYGATCDEVEAVLDLRHQTASAALWRLKRSGWVKELRETRTTRGGRSAGVCIITDAEDRTQGALGLAPAPKSRRPRSALSEEVTR